MSGDDVPNEIVDVRPDWSPSGEVDVERALRGLEHLAARFAEVQANAVAWRADISEWEARQTAAISAKATVLSLALEGWALAMRRMSGNKTKSFFFPSGSIETAKARTTTLVTDEAAALAWCKENLPDAVKTEVSLLKSVIAKRCELLDDGRYTLDGEVVPGIQQQVLPDSAASAVVKLASQRALPRGGA